MKSKVGTLLAIVALLASSGAHALTITPAGPGLIGDGSGLPSPQNANCEPGCIPGADSTWDLLYKSDVSGSSGVGSDSGFLKDSYNTQFSNSASDPANALITYVGGPSLNCAPSGKCLAAIKDGNNSPYYYFFDLGIAGWNGTDDLLFSGFWPGNGAISHVSIWGPNEDTCCNDEKLPEPGTLALLGFGLTGLALIGRRRRREF